MVVKMAGMNTDIVLELSEFDISLDKMESKYQRKLSGKTLAEINEILRIVDSDPQTAIDRLINLLEKNPDNPILKNHPATNQTKRIVKPPFPLRILRKLLSPKDKIR